uniref:Elongator complex protein 1 n=1 Tax=Echinococcus granulosus TaxID=6210 RepID=A0A068WFG3_ECHGR|nr:elongator complex protein 1 [Echinococcus granulosus]
MRNLRTLAHACKTVPGIAINDIHVDKFSDFWIATNAGLRCVQRGGGFVTHFHEKCVLKIAYVNPPFVCIQCGDSIILFESPDQYVNVLVILFTTAFFLPSLTDLRFLEVLSAPSSVLPVEIAWREDGAYFVITWSDSSGPEARRRLHIFEAGGVLHSVGAGTDALETGLCWRPKVQLIAVSKRRAGSCLQMAFYELNGLQHGEVHMLSAPDCDMFRIGKTTFDMEEHIMAVLFLPLDSANNTNLPFVRLYISSNYHWSMKTELSPLPRPRPPPSTPLGRVSLTFGNANEAGTVTLYTAVSLGIGVEGSYLSSWSLVGCIDRSAWHPGAEDPAIVAVIDSCNVGLTALAHATIPPPMCATRLIFPSAVGAVSLSPAWPNAVDDGVTLFVQPTDSTAAPWVLALATNWCGPQRLTSANLTVLQQRQQAAPDSAPCATKAWALKKDAVVYASETASSIFHGQLLHATWISPKKLCFVSQDGRHLGMLTQLMMNDSVTFEVRCLASLANTATSVINGLVYGLSGEIVVQVGDGGIHIVKLKCLEDTARCGSTAVYEFPDVTPASFPFACDQIYAVSFSCQSQALHQTHLVGLQSSSHQLCALPWPTPATRATMTGECVMRSCSSLFLHSDFLLVTSLKNQLFTVPLALESMEFHSVVASLKKRLNSNNFAPRALESGARLVAAVARASKTVLQMPRGNLEEIHPRALVFNHLAPIFDSMRYADAIETMRRHRINFNLLYDYDPPKFLSSVANFVHQISSPEHITLLVSDLTEEDITKTEYNGFFGSKRPLAQAALAEVATHIRDDFPRAPLTEPYPATKVNLVCEALLKAMLPEPKKFILPILTCYVKMQPQEVEKGLALLNDFKDKGDVDVWERGLRQLQYYVSPVKLFHIALGTYNLVLAEAMADRTQLDPKEYQPCLQQLRALCADTGDNRIASTAYQHARIDLLLHRYSKALQSLHSAGLTHWEEFREVVKKQKLFSEALDLLVPGTPQFSEISRLWARELVASRRLVAAGEVHLRANHFASAALIFLSTNSTRRWRVAVACAAASSTADAEAEEVLSAEEVHCQASRLAMNLTSLGRFEEAISIYSECLHDYEGAVSIAAEGGLWLEARRLAHHAADTGSMMALLKRSALKASEDIAVRLTTEAEDFRKSFERLLEIRAELKERTLNSTFGVGDEIFDNTESELFSDTGSVVSATSVGSRDSFLSKSYGRSQKNRRKRERKKWSTKRGSKFEEVALIQVLHTTIASCQRLFETIQALTDELWRCGESATAAKLARQADGLLLDHRAALKVVWCNEITGETALGLNEDGDVRPARRYPFHEAFLLFPPVMTIQRINCDFL